MSTNDKGKLHVDTLSSLELWKRLHSHQRARPNNAEAIIQLINLLEHTQQKWREVSQENAHLSDLLTRLKRQLGNYEKYVDECRETNRGLEAKLASANTLIGNLQSELREYEQRFQAVKMQLQNAPIPPSTPTEPLLIQQENGTERIPSTIVHYPNNMFEQTNRMISQKGKRRSSSPQLVSVVAGEKRPRPGRIDEELGESPEAMNERNGRPSKIVRSRPVMNRSMSESRVYEPTKPTRPPQQAPMSAKHATTSTLDIRNSPMSGFGCGWTKGRPIEQCEHNYVQVNNLFSAAFSYCSVCARGLGMRGLRCNGCKLQIHENCLHQAPLPCVPMISTPQRSTTRQRPTLGDLCPDLPPQIPGQIIRCVVALEKGFIGTVGLYRVPGCDSEVKKLKENFNSKYVPKLDQIDPETITGFIKKFLRDLREPLIPFSSYKEFLKAVTEGNEAHLKTSIEELPGSNRDTLAYLCAHWQKVAMHCNENQMPLDNLAKVLGPTVVGTTSKLATLQQSGKQQFTANYAMEAGTQIQILHALLSLDHCYWTAFYDGPPPSQQWPGTPRSSRAINNYK